MQIGEKIYPSLPSLEPNNHVTEGSPPFEAMPLTFSKLAKSDQTLDMDFMVSSVGVHFQQTHRSLLLIDLM
eukprot:747245-Hanusia_phi.AAC.3